ncbi:MAG: nuclear transport factor 2 family protein [Promethearchaeota archaeon]
MKNLPNRNAEMEKKIIKEEILKYYHEGHVKSDPELYKELLHDEWKFYLFHDDGRLRIVDKNEYLSWYNPNEINVSLSWKTEFYYIDVTEKIGAVKLKIECEEVGYIDYFNLMKIDGKWWIVHKISHKIK